EELGYPARELDGWARRAEALASGARPKELDYVSARAEPVASRDVFLYVISGHKVRNPRDAIALQERLGERAANERTCTGIIAASRRACESRPVSSRPPAASPA